jgi:hypothetical protein
MRRRRSGNASINVAAAFRPASKRSERSYSQATAKKKSQVQKADLSYRSSYDDAIRKL